MIDSVRARSIVRVVAVFLLVVSGAIPVFACSQSHNAQMSTPSTPLLDEFRLFCVSSLTRPEAVERLADENKAVLISSNSIGVGRNGPFKTWRHKIDNHTILITSVSSIHTAFAAGRPGCMAVDNDDKSLSLEAVRRWLGIRPGKGLDRTQFRFTYGSGQPALVSEDSTKGVHSSPPKAPVFDLVVMSDEGTSILMYRSDPR
jgi:hypothetical protein